MIIVLVSSSMHPIVLYYIKESPCIDNGLLYTQVSKKRFSDAMEMVQQAKDRSRLVVWSCQPIIYSVVCIIRERKRRRSAKCMEIKDEAVQLLTVLGGMIKSCKHPQHLTEATSKMMEQDRQSLTKTISELDHMIHNQSSTKDKVCKSCYHGDVLLIVINIRSQNIMGLLPWLHHPLVRSRYLWRWLTRREMKK